MRRWLLGIAMLGAAACGGGSSSSSPRVDASSSTGGASGTDGPTFEVAHSCAVLPDLYIAQLGTAKSCDPDGGAAQCQASVTLDLACGCQTFVNDPSVLNDLAAQWKAQACAQSDVGAMGCVGGCKQEGPATCVAVGGGGACTPSP
jgi:hypothetical protein